MIEIKLQFDDRESLTIQRAAAKGNMTLLQLARWATLFQSNVILNDNNNDNNNGTIEDPWGKGKGD